MVTVDYAASFSSLIRYRTPHIGKKCAFRRPTRTFVQESRRRLWARTWPGATVRARKRLWEGVGSANEPSGESSAGHVEAGDRRGGADVEGRERPELGDGG